MFPTNDQLTQDMITTSFEPNDQDMISHIMWPPQETCAPSEIINFGFSNLLTPAEFNTGEIFSESLLDPISGSFEISASMNNFVISPVPNNLPHRLEQESVSNIRNIKNESNDIKVQIIDHNFHHLQTSVVKPELEGIEEIEESIELNKKSDKQAKKVKPGKSKNRNSTHKISSRRNSSSTISTAKNSSPLTRSTAIGSFHKFECFPLKLFSLASDEKFDAIEWTPDGTKIEINTKKMEPLLHCLFRTNKYASFLRQLHLYGFRKAKSSPKADVGLYFNQYFQRDQQELITNISRK